MNKAIVINRTNQLDLIEDYDTVYFGCEFCERLLPSKQDFLTVKEFVENKGKKFCLLSPYVTNRGVDNLRIILGAIGDCEVIFNDWGVFWMIKKDFSARGFSPVIGRLLVKQKRGPRILDYKDKISLEAYEHFRRSIISNPNMVDYLVELGIIRAEFDNLLQGVDLKVNKIKGSLYYPYLYVTSTRMCLIANMGHSEIGVVGCNRQCRGKLFCLKSDAMPDILLRGNTQFIKNEILPKELGIVDRLVFEPEIPY
ncbi:hypothetical protein K9M79_03695 [Candidatus Woesearchaeota archaeon]|nr:hypothetical protein [Candidatus Woesearchaeota archaeon]